MLRLYRARLHTAPDRNCCSLPNALACPLPARRSGVCSSHHCRSRGRTDTSTEPQTRVELSLIGTDEARLRVLFDGLAGGGTVRAKLERQFWGDIFGAVTDRYGIGWQVNIGAAGT